MKGWHKVKKKDLQLLKRPLINHLDGQLHEVFLECFLVPVFNLTVSWFPPTVKSADVPPLSINLIE